MIKLKKNLIAKQLARTYNLIKKKPFNLAYPVLIDLSFLFIYGFFAFMITSRIIYYFYLINDLITKNTEVFKSSFVITGFLSALIQIGGGNLIKKALFWIAALLMFIYFCYSFFQSLSWRYSLNLSGKKYTTGYMKRFFKINLFWLLFFIAYNAISITLGFRKQIVSRYAQVADFSFIIVVFVILWLYFMFISYSLIEKHKVKESIKKTFVLGMTNIKYIVPMYLTVVAVFAALDYTMYYLGNISPKISAVIGIFIALPLFACARLYTYLVVSHLAR